MTDTDRKRLVAILGMLGSASAGERDNAARMAEQFRRQHRMTWEEMFADPIYIDRIIEQPVYRDPPPAPPPPPSRTTNNVAQLASDALGLLIVLSPFLLFLGLWLASLTR